MVLVLWACLVLGMARGESPAPEPLMGDQPFAVVWNIPTGRCQRRFGVRLPLGDYGIVENQDGRFTGQNITIFYKNKFGLYPYLSRQGTPYHGGIPQRVRLGAHLTRAAGDIRRLLRPAFHGLAVVDWEEWRPLWAQNWGAKRIYRAASEQWVRDWHGLLPARQRLRLARWQFEQAAQVLMEETLLLGRTLRPGGLWGFYRFPNCLNGNWLKEANYTGQCQPAEVERNNQLGWLWAASAALYPSIYLPPMLPPALRRRYVHHRLREALRVAAFGTGGLLPVVAYSRLSFRRSPRFLELADLVHTIGESAALGAAGLVLWGDMSYSRSAVSMAPWCCGHGMYGTGTSPVPAGEKWLRGLQCWGEFSPVLPSPGELCQPAPLPCVHPGSLCGQRDSSSPGVQLQTVPRARTLRAPAAPRPGQPLAPRLWCQSTHLVPLPLLPRLDWQGLYPASPAWP
ncbi:hyaluronidase-3 isoform X1 [Dryobates pubescens]|uniref:hyaluronidase-3 isoform X1 n=1 Tax=Dryobates pubescens TaxID=118200 RepID=UPI0023B8C035|nr:hyaluronidase-3 isoform X1 [Dryobates pubescens]